MEKNVSEEYESVSTLGKSAPCRSLSFPPARFTRIVFSLQNCSTITTLLVGPNQVKLTCHKALLGHFSHYFNGALYGGFREAVTQEIQLLDDKPEAIGAFITWVYSGQVESFLGAEELWVLGDKLQSPAFANEAMHLIYSIYGLNPSDGGTWLTAAAADYVWNNTGDESRLRIFMKELISHDGPLCQRALETTSESAKMKEDWHKLIEDGGELVLEIFRSGSFLTKDDTKESPWREKNWHKYLLPVDMPPIDDFIEGTT